MLFHLGNVVRCYPQQPTTPPICHIRYHLHPFHFMLFSLVAKQHPTRMYVHLGPHPSVCFRMCSQLVQIGKLLDTGKCIQRCFLNVEGLASGLWSYQTFQMPRLDQYQAIPGILQFTGMQTLFADAVKLNAFTFCLEQDT